MQSNQSKLILDIETIGVDFETLDKFSQEHIKKYSENEEGIEEAKERLGLSPLTGQIVAIGTLDANTNTGIVYVVSNEKSLPAELEPSIKLIGGSETEILNNFWTLAQNYNTFITFNGRAFDAPFLMIRSAILGIKPTKNLLANRYLSLQPYVAKHIDLFDQFGFYGASRTRSSLHFWAKAFGIPSPKDSGITGDDVGKLFKNGKILDIAKYNLGDIRATGALYDKWEKYLSF